MQTVPFTLIPNDDAMALSTGVVLPVIEDPEILAEPEEEQWT